MLLLKEVVVVMVDLVMEASALAPPMLLSKRLVKVAGAEAMMQEASQLRWVAAGRREYEEQDTTYRNACVV
jgi:hypothetical protein